MTEVSKELKQQCLQAAKDMWARFMELPQEVRDTTCRCDKQDFVAYRTLLYEPKPCSDPDYPKGFFCSNCKKTYIYSIWTVLEKPDLYKNLMKGNK